MKYTTDHLPPLLPTGVQTEPSFRRPQLGLPVPPTSDLGSLLELGSYHRPKDVNVKLDIVPVISIRTLNNWFLIVKKNGLSIRFSDLLVKKPPHDIAPFVI